MDRKKLREAAACLREGVSETTTYLLDEFPHNHRRRIRTDNMIERLNREIRRRTKVVGAFPNGQSALMLICARIQYVTQTWNERRYLDMSTQATTVEPTTQTGITNEPEPKCANQ
jgi:transposase-like protein